MKWSLTLTAQTLTMKRFGTAHGQSKFHSMSQPHEEGVTDPAMLSESDQPQPVTQTCHTGAESPCVRSILSSKLVLNNHIYICMCLWILFFVLELSNNTLMIANACDSK
ncbi:hypothetical protein AVEN_218420-1 [Araneus ventricosus]|uniref:Uncharacterized protein n=1 Tax=Araneus ventricosus TaxID=182803 RepID=A0A4Y2MTU6_ARAVE|nr:hypothetical protein AVEN_218420-1 [Araneus ventricosus]